MQQPTIDPPDPCEELLASEALDLVRAMVRAKQADHLDTSVRDDGALRMLGFVPMPDHLMEALRLTGLVDDA